MKNVVVLIVDDDPAFVAFVRKVLSTIGYAPALTAYDPEQALACLQSERIDVVLLDVELGASQDGFELYESILREFGIPVIFLTARPEASVAGRVDRHSVHGLLFKPVQPTELDVAIAAAVRNRNAERALVEKRADLENVVWHTTDPAVVVASDGTIEMASAAFLEWIDEDGASIRGRSIADFLIDRAPEAPAESGPALLRINPDETVAVHVHAVPLKGQRKELLIPRVETQPEQKLTILSQVFDTMVEGVFVLDSQRRFIYANRSFLKMLDFKRHEIEGHHISKIASRRYGVRFVGRIWSVLKQSGRWEGSMYLTTRNGSERSDWINLTAMRQEGRIVHIVGLVLDVSERKRHEEMLFFMAHHDHLTGLPNRSFFEEHLERALLKARRSGRKGAVFFIDLDGFKGINDTLGHKAGDDILRVAARRLTDVLRKTDIVGRFGGDEFLILVDDLIDYEHSLRIADKVLQALNSEVMLKDHVVKIGASVGISLFPKEGHVTQEIMQMADAGMYLAKRSGGCTYRYSDREMEKMAGRWRKYREEQERESRERQVQFALIRNARTNDIYALQPDMLVDREASTRGGLAGILAELPSTWMEGYWRFLGSLRDESTITWRRLLVGRRILVRTPAATLAPGEVLHELLAELRRCQCIPVLEMTDVELEKLLEFEKEILNDFLRDGIRIFVRETHGSIVSSPMVADLPVEGIIIGMQDAEHGGEEMALQIRKRRRAANAMGLTVIFDGVTDADALEALDVAQGDLYRGPLAGDMLSVAELESLLQK